MKFWQDYIQYKKFRFHANMAAIKFMQELNYYKLEVCFNALKKNKETRKMKIMVQALNGDMNVAINHFTAQTNSSVNRLHTANKRRAL
jgi:predicted transport protein